MDKQLARVIKAAILYLALLPMLALPVGELRAQQILPGVLNPQPSSVTYSPMLTSNPSVMSIRTDTNYVGYQFTANTVTIQQLCRWKISGNTGTHTVALVNSGGIIAEVSINTTLGTAGTYQCSSDTTAGSLPATLSSGTLYQVLSCEGGGDQWYDAESYTYDTAFAIGSGATAMQNAYSTSCTVFGTGGGSGSNAWVPVNLTR